MLGVTACQRDAKHRVESFIPTTQSRHKGPLGEGPCTVGEVHAVSTEGTGVTPKPNSMKHPAVTQQFQHWEFL